MCPEERANILLHPKRLRTHRTTGWALSASTTSSKSDEFSSTWGADYRSSQQAHHATTFQFSRSCGTSSNHCHWEPHACEATSAWNSQRQSRRPHHVFVQCKRTLHQTHSGHWLPVAGGGALLHDLLPRSENNLFVQPSDIFEIIIRCIKHAWRINLQDFGSESYRCKIIMFLTSVCKVLSNLTDRSCDCAASNSWESR